MDNEQMAGSDSESIKALDCGCTKTHTCSSHSARPFKNNCEPVMNLVSLNATIRVGANDPIKCIKANRLIAEFKSLVESNGVEINVTCITGYMDDETMRTIYK